MATSRITLKSVCAGGDHIVLTTSVAQGTFDLTYTADELLTNLTQDDLNSATIIMARFHCQNMTRVQAATALNSGIVIRTSV